MTDTTTPQDPAQAVAALEERLRATPRAARPLEHATLRYQLGMAYAELPTGERQLNLTRAVAQYREAARLFTPARFPLEHARVQNALGAAHRELGAPAEAAEACRQAIELLRVQGEAPTPELGAALNNLGLALSDQDEHEQAADALQEALRVFTEAGALRQRVMVLHNLGQTKAAAGEPEAAIACYTEALEDTDPDELPYQWGLLHHARGSARTAVEQPGEAAQDFAAALRVFTRQRYPFQYALAKNNYGLANAQRGDVTSLRRAVVAYEDALGTLDVRLHRAQWQQAFQNLELVEAALAEAGEDLSRPEHYAWLLTEVDREEALELLRARLTPLVGLPERTRLDTLTELATALSRLPVDRMGAALGPWVTVLMELPDVMLTAGLQAWMSAERDVGDPARRDEIATAMDQTIQEELLAPQRMRVRDALEALGWERP